MHSGSLGSMEIITTSLLEFTAGIVVLSSILSHSVHFHFILFFFFFFSLGLKLTGYFGGFRSFAGTVFPLLILVQLVPHSFIEAQFHSLLRCDARGWAFGLQFYLDEDGTLFG
jgi:hypothetical protein